MSLQTIDDALSVLEYLAGAGEARALSRISRDLEISKARMHRVLTTLVSRGYVSRDPLTSHYGFGPSCGSLAAQARAGISLSRACSPVLRWLWEQTQETVYLAVLEIGHAIVIDKLDSTHDVIATSTLGRALPLHGVSAGKVLLASRPDHELEALIPRSIAAYPKARPSDPALILADIQLIRTQGYAENRGGFRDGVAGIAAPIRWDNSGRVVAAIAVCLPASRFAANADSLRRHVISAASLASSAIGAASDQGPAADVAAAPAQPAPQGTTR